MKRITSFLLAMVLFAGLLLTSVPVARAASEMVASDALIEVLKQEEGFAAKPYWDHSQYTVGYGTRCPSDMVDYYKEHGISEEAAETLLRNYLARTEQTINTKFIDKYGVTLTQGQFDALVSLTYNCGSGWIGETDGTLHNVVKNGGSDSEVIRAFTLWCSAGGQILPGLVRRRLSEANMYINETYTRAKPEHYCYVYFNANGGSVAYRIQGYDATKGTAPAFDAVYSGYQFLGWFTEKSGGTKVTELTQSMSGNTLYAHWEYTGETNEEVPGGSSAEVTVTVTGSDVNLRKGPGTNYGIAGTASKGDKLTITETDRCERYQWGKSGDSWICLSFTNYSEICKEEEKVPEVTQPETTVPETTQPETTVPETTEPTVPETTEPTVPETTEPTEPETTEPTVPETTEPAVPETTEPAETKPAETKVTGKVKANGGLNVRKGPGTGYVAVRYLKDGTSVTITEQKTVGSMTWGNLGDGWVSMKFVMLDKEEPNVPETTVPEPTEPETTEPKPTEPAVPESTAPSDSNLSGVTGKVKVSDGLSVRKGPGTNYGILKYLNNGAKVTITELRQVKETTWGKVGDGWVSMDYVVLDEDSVQNATKTVTADCLRVRESANTGAKIVDYLYKGAKVMILDTKKMNGITWGKISTGWISMEYVK